MITFRCNKEITYIIGKACYPIPIIMGYAFSFSVVDILNRTVVINIIIVCNMRVDILKIPAFNSSIRCIQYKGSMGVVMLSDDYSVRDIGISHKEFISHSRSVILVHRIGVITEVCSVSVVELV